MKVFLILIATFFSGLIFDFNRIKISNEIKEKAVRAYLKEDYLLSIKYHHELIKVFDLKEEAVFINLANSYFKIGDFKSALKFYKSCLKSEEGKVRSEVNHQIGIIHAYNGKEKLALNYFKEALKANFFNEAARYNFELLKNKLDNDTTSHTIREKHEQKSKSENTNGDNEAESEIETEFEDLNRPDKRDGEGSDEESNEKSNNENKDSAEGLKDDATANKNKGEVEGLKADESGKKQTEILKSKKYEEIKLSEAKAKMILEQMKIQEFLFINKLKERKVVNKTSEGQDW